MAQPRSKHSKAPFNLSIDISDEYAVSSEEPLSTSHMPKVLTTRNHNLPKDFSTYTPKPRPSLLSSQTNAKLKLFTPLQPSSAALEAPQSPKHTEAVKEHWRLTLQSLLLASQTPLPDLTSIRDRAVSLPRLFPTRKTLILDLDETLVHCDSTNPEVILLIALPAGASGTAGISVRPFVRELLETMAEIYEIVVFTASQRHYADSVIDYLDPEGRLIHHRLYRESCLSCPNGLYIKDLRILAGRKLQDIVIVDNTVYSFCLQLDNGIPILSWQDDMQDRELVRLAEYLRRLAEVPDIRVVNRATFQLYRLGRDAVRLARSGKENKPSVNAK